MIAHDTLYAEGIQPFMTACLCCMPFVAIKELLNANADGLAMHRAEENILEQYYNLVCVEYMHFFAL